MSKSNRPSPDSSVNRRAFFRKLLARSVEKVEEAGRAFAERVSDSLPPDAKSPPASQRPKTTAAEGWPVDYGPLPPAATRYLRPPGAVPEPLMDALCSRCGDCAAACPANCIELDPDGSVALGLPYIEARKSPCVVCTDLSCMKACQTGALKLVDRAEQINMGDAVVNDMSCLRGPHGDREDCRLCIERCPLGTEAIQLDPHHNIVQVLEGCIGCGVCEQVCPTEPASIWVEPRIG